MTDDEMAAAAVEMYNNLFRTVLQKIAEDDPDLAALWLQQSQQAGGWHVGLPVDGWADVTVDGTLFVRMQPAERAGRWIVRFAMWGRERELELAMIGDDGDVGEVG